jgi:hypothetical protein
MVIEIENYFPERLKWRIELKRRRSAEVEVEVPDAIKLWWGMLSSAQTLDET